jgi:hypothetical protein
MSLHTLSLKLEDKFLNKNYYRHIYTMLTLNSDQSSFVQGILSFHASTAFMTLSTRQHSRNLSLFTYVTSHTPHKFQYPY